MSEKKRSIISMVMVMAVSLLLAFPFAPAVASDADAAGMHDAAMEALVVEEEEADRASGEVEGPDEGMGEQELPGEATISVVQEPWEVTSLDIWKDIDKVTPLRSEIGLEKTASETYFEMMVGETKEVIFTIEVDAEMSELYYIEGNIYVDNTGDWPADVIAVSDTIWYKAGGPNWLAAASNIHTDVPLGDNAIPTGGTHVYNYWGTFSLPVPLASVTSMSNLIEITISNKPDPPKPGMQDWTFHSREDFDKPGGNGSTEVVLEDVETITPSEGLSYEVKSVEINGASTANLTGPWGLDLADAPFTIVIVKDLIAEAVGNYNLNNKAIIGDLESEVDVEIVVDKPEERGRISGEKIDFTTQDPVEGVKFVLEGDEFYAEAFSNEEGFFDFGWLLPGEYLLYEIVPEGWVSVSATEHEIELADGDEKHFVFMNKRLSAIYGYKWLDANADGIRQDGESGLAGVTILLEGMGISEERVTDADGYFIFEGLLDGQYLIMEKVPDGYYATSAVEVDVMLEAGEEKRVDFLNAPLAMVLGTKWLDLNANGEFDDGEEGLAGVTIHLRDSEGDVLATRVTASDGTYSFEGLKAGAYTVEEVVGDGYVATAPVSVYFDLSAGEKKVVDFFNNVEVGGEIVVPPAEADPGQTLPATGFEMSFLLLMIGLLILTGASIATYGLVRIRRID